MNMEQALVRRVLAGDAEAEEIFAMTFRPRLIRASVYFVGAEGTEAEDIVRDTFADAWPELQDRAFNGPVYPWLRQICLRQCYVRLHVRQQLVLSLEKHLEALLQRRALQRLRGCDLGAYSRGKIALRHELMMRLSPDSRQVIEERNRRMNYADISRALGLPLGPVLSRLARALNQMRLLLEREPEDCPNKKAET